MDNQKEIEEISQIAITMGQCPMETCEKCKKQANNPYCVIFEQAVILHKCGYGNVKQAVEEFAENVVNSIIDELVTLMFDDYKSTCKVDDCDKGSDIPCGSSICIQDNQQVWKNKVAQKMKELYGED